MKYVNILTFHKEASYGAVLQTYALCTTLKAMGANPRIINLSKTYSKYPYTKKYRILKFCSKILKGYFVHGQITKYLIGRFRKGRFPTQIGNFHSIEELRRFPWSKDDIYIVGSDQVWNSEIAGLLRDAYYFSFLPDNFKNIYSYAASFGSVSNMDTTDISVIHKYLMRFRQIAVRERTGIDFLKKQFNIDALEVLDPTLLVEDYSALLPQNIKQSKTLFYFHLAKNENLHSCVKQIADKRKLMLRNEFGCFSANLKALHFPTVEDWLSNIASSELIVTDSFHAMIFSIILEKPFYIFINVPSRGSRLVDMLEKLGLKNRLINEDSISHINEAEDIDYRSVKEKLQKEIQISKRYLHSILSES
jgi:hypothetical protein